MPNAAKYAKNYDDAILKLLGALFGCSLSKRKLEEISLPVAQGGIGLSSSEYIEEQYKT